MLNGAQYTLGDQAAGEGFGDQHIGMLRGTSTKVDFFASTLMRSAKPFLATISRARSAISGMVSQVVTCEAPARAAINASNPAPVPISSTRLAGTAARIAVS